MQEEETIRLELLLGPATMGRLLGSSPGRDEFDH